MSLPNPSSSQPESFDVLADILLVCGIDDHFDDEEVQDFFQRIIKSVSEVPDRVWDQLHIESQTWVNAGVDAIQAGAEVEPPQGFYEVEQETSIIDVAVTEALDDAIIAEEEQELEEEEEGEEEDIPPPPVAHKPVASKPGVNKKKPYVGKKSPNRFLQVGAIERMKQIIVSKIVVDGQDITPQVLLDQLRAEKHKATLNTVRGILSDCKQTIRVFQELGVMKTPGKK